MWRSICLPNFDEISQSTAEIKLLPVSENGRQPYWNSISGFDVDVCVVIGMSLSFCLPNFVVIERSAAELWRHVHFSRWRPYSRKCTSVFRFDDGVCLRMWKSICLPNFDEISIHGWDKTTSGFGKRTVAILEFSFRFRCWRMYSHRHVILHLPAKFRSNQSIAGGVLTLYLFFKMAAGNHIGFDLDNVSPPTMCNCRSQFDPQIWFWSDLKFWRYCDFYILPFWLEIAYSRPFWGVLGAYFPQIWSPIVQPPKGPSLRENTSFEP